MREHHGGRPWRLAVVLVVLLGSLLTAPATDVTAASPPSLDARQASRAGVLYFPETGFTVDEPRFVDYFNRRGGVATFGFPTSRTIRFQGVPTQFFQRMVIQAVGENAVQPLNLLDPGLLPYTQINGSTFPAPNERLAALAPAPNQPGYGKEVLEFVRRNAPEMFNGQPVRFFSTFNNTVSPEAAFGRGGGDPNLLPLINLEIWGVPTSLPAQDPNNGNFIYQRFQRGIMHYDANCRCTQGLLLADYFKSLLTGENLPSDLEAQAKGSPFLRQFAPDRPTSLRQPLDLPGTDLTSAFTKQSAPAASALAPAVTASNVSTGPSSGAASTSPTAFKSRIRLGAGLGTAIDVMEMFGLIEPLQALVDSDAEVSFGPLDELRHARYIRFGDSGAGGIRSIIVNTAWRNADPKAIATLIVHETKHLEDDMAGFMDGFDPRTPEQCYQFEIRAFTEQALAWQAMYGPNGKAEPRDKLDVELNDWLVLYRRGPKELEKRVRSLYEKENQCSRTAPHVL